MPTCNSVIKGSLIQGRGWIIRDWSVVFVLGDKLSLVEAGCGGTSPCQVLLFTQWKLPLQNSCVPKKMLQLVGVTAMFIASKYEEMYPPEMDDFAYITNNTYTKHQIRQMEMKILRVLSFGLGRPLPLHFLHRVSKIGEVRISWKTFGMVQVREYCH